MSGTRPLVSIVTPSLNAGRFLDEAIQSVLGQDYPHVEYLVMDAGSTDDTCQVLRRYEGRLRYVSAPDQGQADAINRGFQRTTGEILAFLNADDAYLPGAISAAVGAFDGHPDAVVVYGGARYVDEAGTTLGNYPVDPFDTGNLARRCFICQPAAFFRRDAFMAAGALDPALRFALDYDLWIRMAGLPPPATIVKIDGTLAMQRLHAGAKTVQETGPALAETIAVLKRYYGYVPFNWIYGYAHHELTGQPIAAARPRPAFASALYAAVLGARHNWRHPLRYCRDVVVTATQ
jgi:glycosyltransferase involved in cell wall biosynthesis